jgi:hypothetical protein
MAMGMRIDGQGVRRRHLLAPRAGGRSRGVLTRTRWCTQRAMWVVRGRIAPCPADGSAAKVCTEERSDSNKWGVVDDSNVTRSAAASICIDSGAASILFRGHVHAL